MTRIWTLGCAMCKAQSARLIARIWQAERPWQLAHIFQSLVIVHKANLGLGLDGIQQMSNVLCACRPTARGVSATSTRTRGRGSANLALKIWQAAWPLQMANMFPSLVTQP